MSKLPYPLDQSGVSLDRYLLHLLCALTRKAGGEIHIPISDIIKVEDSVLLRYPTANLREIVLKLAPRSTDLFVVPEAPPWPVTQAPARPQRPSEPVPTQEPHHPAAAPRVSNTLDNLNLYLKEQEREEKLRQMQQADEVEARHQAGLSTFRTIPGR